MADRNCQSCGNYKDEYCSELDMKPCYPEKGCDYFSERNKLKEDTMQILDKIRAEIIELRSRQNVGVLECLDIIDKYMAEGSEE